MSRPPRLKPLFYSTLFIFLWIHAVFGQDQNSRLDVLRGNDDENSCTLKANIYKGCSLSPPLIFNATVETPAACTCNKVFFNIWSACSYSIGENLFPVFKDWMSICTASGINLEQAQHLADKNNWGVIAPDWAKVDVPGDKTMDLQEAVLVTQSKWSALQIVLPFITALVAIFVTMLIMQLYHTRLQRASWRERALRLVRPIPKVKNVDKYDSWEIEANEGAQYELVVPPSRASDPYAFGPNAPQQIRTQHQPLHRGGHSRTDSEVFDEDEAGWGSLKNVRLPWKKDLNVPNRVQEVHATTEFDIDDHTAPSTTAGFTSDVESMYSQRRPAVSETDVLGAGQPSVGPPPVVSKDYSDPFSEQSTRR